MHEAVADRHPGKLIAWVVFVGALALLSYSAQLADTAAPDDLAYQYTASVAGLVQYGIILGVLLLIARGLPLRQAFALRRPKSWPGSVAVAFLGLLVIYVAAYVYERVLSVFGDWNPADEQGLVPDGWDSSRAGAFVAFFLVVTFVGPAVEELSFRGLGMSLLMPYGAPAAILVSGVLFGAMHGLIVAFPILAIFGIVVGVVRTRTDSVYPGMLLHATFNGTALIASVTVLG